MIRQIVSLALLSFLHASAWSSGTVAGIADSHQPEPDQKTGSVQNAGSDETWSFDVYLDDKPIGFHRFELREDNGVREVSSEAEFEVRVFFFKAFSYQHQNVEIWKDSCLASINASTTAGGKQFEVQGHAEAGQFRLATDAGDQPVDDCVATFAYWDPQLLQRERLLNSQTGEYLEVQLTRLPVEQISVGAGQVTVEPLQIKAKDVDIKLSYAVGSGEWLGLESTLKNGRTLVYRRDQAELDNRNRIARVQP